MTKRARRAVQPPKADSDPLNLLFSARQAVMKFMPLTDKGRLRHFSVYVFEEAGFYAIYEYMNSGVEIRLAPHEWPTELLKKIG